MILFQKNEIKYNLNKVKEGRGRKGLNISIYLNRNGKLFYFGGLDYKSLSLRILFDLTCSNIKVSTEHFLLQISACVLVVASLNTCSANLYMASLTEGIEMPDHVNFKKSGGSHKEQ